MHAPLHTRLQQLANDPIMTSARTLADAAESFGIAILLWLILGANLSWAKGAVPEEEHVWIGVAFKTQNGSAMMTILPQHQATLTAP